MRSLTRTGLVVLAAILIVLLLSQITQVYGSAGISQNDGKVTLTLIGWVANTQDQPVGEAEVRVFIGGEQQGLTVAGEEVKAARTSAEGFYIADLNLSPAMLEGDTLAVVVSKPGYRVTRQGFAQQRIAHAADHYYTRVPDVVLPRVFNPAFFIATGIFFVVFGLISFNVLHETIAAFVGAAAMLAVSYFFGSFNADYWIISFHRAIQFIDFDVIFLLLTMMIFMAVMSQTGVFQWLAFRAFRLARGNAYLVTAVLVLITAITSSVLNDTTVMLLMAPVSIQIALALKIHPASIVVPEVLASNIGGAATLIGTPPNTIIGSYVGLSFNQFLANMLPIAVMGMILLLFMTRWLYRTEYEKEGASASGALVEQLEAGAQITNPVLLRKSLFLFGLTMVLFFVEDLFQMPPAVVAILGSTALLLWVRPDVGEMLREVDWTTLVFFMALFMMVGGVQEVGLIQVIAESVQNIAGGNLLLATLLVIWVSAFASAIVANIPFAAAMVPVTVYLTHTIPGAENNVLYWALALGAGLGGNATYIGSAPNIVAAGVLDRAGFRLKFADFSKVGVPVTFVTLLVPTLWILLRYFVLKF
ncbi:MAG: SLC13 family permease [Anaerolineae bacterium]|jgi:Na+/H+ antiporter NhaD/arsenite permease-like protein